MQCCDWATSQAAPRSDLATNVLGGPRPSSCPHSLSPPLCNTVHGQWPTLQVQMFGNSVVSSYIHGVAPQWKIWTVVAADAALKRKQEQHFPTCWKAFAGALVLHCRYVVKINAWLWGAWMLIANFGSVVKWPVYWKLVLRKCLTAITNISDRLWHVCLCVSKAP